MIAILSLKDIDGIFCPFVRTQFQSIRDYFVIASYNTIDSLFGQIAENILKMSLNLDTMTGIQLC